MAASAKFRSPFILEDGPRRCREIPIWYGEALKKFISQVHRRRKLLLDKGNAIITNVVDPPDTVNVDLRAQDPMYLVGVFCQSNVETLGMFDKEQ